MSIRNFWRPRRQVSAPIPVPSPSPSPNPADPPVSMEHRRSVSALPEAVPPSTEPVLPRESLIVAPRHRDVIDVGEEAASSSSNDAIAHSPVAAPSRAARGEPVDPKAPASSARRPSSVKLPVPNSVRHLSSPSGIAEPRVSAAYRLFESGDTERALAVLEGVAGAGPLEAGGRELLDLLLPDPAPIDIVDAVLRRNDDRLSPIERARWLARRFDSLPLETDAAREAALDLLGSATMAGNAGWAIVQDPVRRARIDLVLGEPDAQIDLMEQEALAPADTGLPSSVPGRALAFGRQMAAQGDFACVREAERLLHVLREPQLAYLLEGERKQRVAWLALPEPVASKPTVGHPDRLTVVLAGGHPPLRRMARRELDELNLANVREFPSGWEGNRQGRHARDTVEGSNLAVVIWRQIAHSTSDQVMAAAKAYAVPVVRADTPTVSAIRRAVSSFQNSSERGNPS